MSTDAEASSELRSRKERRPSSSSTEAEESAKGSHDVGRSTSSTPSTSSSSSTKTSRSSSSWSLMRVTGKLMRFVALWLWILATLPVMWGLVGILRPLNPLLRRLGIRDGLLPMDLLQGAWARSLVFVAGIRVRVDGHRHLKPFIEKRLPAIYMPNHTSGLDPFILNGFLPINPRFIFKRSLMLQAPPIFVLAYLFGHIPINRSKRQDAIQSLKAAEEKIAQGRSILIFPEGTRSKTGKLLPFKRGGFYLAHNSGAAIVPIYVEGAFELWNTAGINFHPDPGTIRMRILPPIMNDKNESVDELEERVLKVLTAEQERKEVVPQRSHYPSLVASGGIILAFGLAVYRFYPC